MKAILVLISCATIALSTNVSAKQENDKPLPPGLAKKMAQGQPLPPGWQKKLAPGQLLADDYYRRGIVLAQPNSNGIVTIQIEGTIIELYQHSREIVRILEGRH